MAEIHRKDILTDIVISTADEVRRAVVFRISSGKQKLGFRFLKPNK